MEALFALLAFCFVVVPLPICIYLLVQKNKLAERLDELERSIRYGEAGRERAPSDPSAAEHPAPATRPILQPNWEARAEPAPTPAAPTPPPPAREAPAAEPAMLRVPPRQTRPEVNATRQAESAPSPEQKIRGFLRSVGFLPPADLELKEAGLIQWWAPRIGGLLAVLTIVFFSVYISNRISPLTRFFQLLAADALVLGVGVYFWKRRRSFGSTLITAGLSMLYVTMVAGYAASPVRVFENPLLGIALQFATVCGIYAASIALKERGIALLATVFGYASCVFSAYLGYDEGALLSAFALQVAGVACAHRFRYAALAGIAALGVYTPIVAFCGLQLIGSESFTVPNLYSVIAFLALAVSVLPFMAWRASISQLFSVTNWRIIAVANTSLCAALGYLYLKLVGGEIVWLYGSLALVFMAWAAIFSRSGLNTLLFQLFFIKACGLAALWLANYFAGELRWFALAIECFLLAWSTRQSRSRWSEAATFLLWIAAFWLALGDLRSGPAIELWTLRWALYSLLPIIGAGALAYQLEALEATSNRKTLYSLAGLASGIVACVVAIRSAGGDSYAAIILAGSAAVFAAIALAPRFSKLPTLAAAVLPLLASHVAFWISSHSILSLLMVDGVAILFAIGWALAIRAPQARRDSVPEFILLSLSVIALYAYLFSGYSEAAWFPYLAPALAIALKALRLRPLRTLADTFLLLPLLDLIFHAEQRQEPLPIILSLVLYALLLATPALRPSWERHLLLLRFKNIGSTLAHLLVAAILLTNVGALESWFHNHLLLLGGAVVFFALWLMHRHRAALLVAALLPVVLLIALIEQSLGFRGDTPWSWQMLTIGGGLAVATLAFGGILSQRPARRVSPGLQRLLIYFFAAISYLSVAFALRYPELTLGSYYTPLIATYCLALIGLGIAMKIKPFRMVALIGFLLPLARLFLFDIQETLHRIIAFAALAVLLTTIGYLYNRFASRIE